VAGLEIISIKVTESVDALFGSVRYASAGDLWLLFLGYVSSRFRDIPAGRFAEPVPEVMKGGEVPRFHRNHSVVCGAPDVGIFSDDLHVFGQVLFEAFPAHGCLLLVSFCERSYAIED
jgi:hypothetical protein